MSVNGFVWINVRRGKEIMRHCIRRVYLTVLWICRKSPSMTKILFALNRGWIEKHKQKPSAEQQLNRTREGHGQEKTDTFRLHTGHGCLMRSINIHALTQHIWYYEHFLILTSFANTIIGQCLAVCNAAISQNNGIKIIRKSHTFWLIGTYQSAMGYWYKVNVSSNTQQICPKNARVQ